MSETKQLTAVTIDGREWRPEMRRGNPINDLSRPMTTEDLAAVLAALTAEQRYELYEPFDDRRRDALTQMMTDLDFAKLDIANAADRAEQAESRAAKLESELSAEREAHAKTRQRLEQSERLSARGWCSPGAPCGQDGCGRCS